MLLPLQERKNCLLSLGRSKELTRDTSEGAFAGYSVEAQAIENWFEDQVSNAYRKTEFDIEVGMYVRVFDLLPIR